ncbi:hypothetical protein EUX98_g8110 [Antrodiella citrinella]|uniref:Enoyl reductase (ER) domain-containing protein n=1 Tax=Antrodiella citrinella TaxID=2447956 RepID=A0A4S4MCP8_9APHY|nr:hypothetical protein EUX98_g8110 [Antrodiella citrinella]
MSIPTHQTALFVQELRGAWKVSSTDVPKPGPGEILIRVEAASLNPVDWKIQMYGVAVTIFPAILGSDSAGTVVEVGEGVTRVAVGDRVLHQGYYHNRIATFQQYTVANEKRVAKIPPKLSFDQAAAIPVALSAAAFGLYGTKVQQGGAGLTAPWREGGRGKYAGQPIVVLGGASSVGQYVIQLAKVSGFSPIITTVSPHNNDLVTALGATHPVDRALPLSELKAITSEPISVVFDAVSSAETQRAGYDLLAPGGTLVLVLDPVGSLGAGEKEGRSVISTYATVHVETNREIGEEMYEHLEAFLESGDLKPNLVEVVPGGLASIPEAFERMKKNQVSGQKLVVRPTESA